MIQWLRYDLEFYGLYRLAGGLDNFETREGSQYIKIKEDSLAVTLVKYSAAEFQERTVTLTVEAPAMANITNPIEVQVPVEKHDGNILIAVVNSLRTNDEVPEMTSEE